jgi:hypothetical protein
VFKRTNRRLHIRQSAEPNAELRLTTQRRQVRPVIGTRRSDHTPGTGAAMSREHPADHYRPASEDERSAPFRPGSRPGHDLRETLCGSAPGDRNGTA